MVLCLRYGYDSPVGPPLTPIGLNLTRTARVVSRAFDDALSQAGGSLPLWLVLLNVKARHLANQRELADAIGVSEATLTHHLNAMEKDGLLTRTRDQANRRIHVISLTDSGEAAFLRLRDVAVAFDRRLRRGISAEELATLQRLLATLGENAAPQEAPAPFAGLMPDQQP
jgi:MarR family transcriptional regulator, transcriptional regulator for hemolysin